MKVLLAWLTLCLVATFPMRSATVTLTAVADTTISQDGLARNAGGGDVTMIVGVLNLVEDRARSLLRFEVSEIPTNAIVTSAEVTLNVVRTFDPSTSDTHTLHRLNAAWQELTATWGHSGAVAWDGGAFESEADASALIGSFGPFTFSSGELAGTVQRWVTNSALNFGWILATGTDANARRFATRESSQGRPQLRVTYVVPQPATLRNPRVQGDQFVFEFTAEPGLGYVAEWLDALGTGEWETVQTFAPSAQATARTVSDTRTATQRFYRVRVQ